MDAIENSVIWKIDGHLKKIKEKHIENQKSLQLFANYDQYQAQ